MKKTSQKSVIASVHDNPALPEIADEVVLRSLRPQAGLLSRLWEWIQIRRAGRSSDKRLRVAEIVSLGEKRFVAVVQVDGRHFLLAGSPNNIVLLAQLQPHDDFEEVLKSTMTVPHPPQKQTRAERAPTSSRPLGKQAAANTKKKSAKRPVAKSAKTRSKSSATNSPLKSSRGDVPSPTPASADPVFDSLLENMPLAGPLMKPASRTNGRYAPGQTEDFA